MSTASGLALPNLEAFKSLDTANLIGRLRFGIEHFDPRVFDLGHEELDRAWLPDAGVGRWSCRALLAHLMDAELVYAYRIRRVLAEDGPVFENFDEDAFLDSPLYGMTPRRADDLAGETLIRTPPGAMAATIHTIRQMTGATLYQVDDTEWARAGVHPVAGAVSLKDLVAMHAWHLEHHGAYLNAKVERLLGPRPPEEACVPGGCGQGCACVGEGGAGTGDGA